MIYLDCEFDGHNGPLLSLGLFESSSERALYLVANNVHASDPWVIENVLPQLLTPNAIVIPLLEFGAHIIEWLPDLPHVIADSPVDITRFCRCISTSSSGEWNSVDFPYMKFEVINIELEMKHHALQDAMILADACHAY